MIFNLNADGKKEFQGVNKMYLQAKQPSDCELSSCILNRRVLSLVSIATEKQEVFGREK